MNNNNQNIFSLNKKKKASNKENKAKEEEDPHIESSLSVEIIPMKYSENLDFVVNGIKVKNYSIER